MADDLISKYVDRQSFQDDTQFVLAQLKEVKGAYESLRDIRNTLSNSSSAVQTIDTAKQMRIETERLRQKNLELNAALKEQRLEAAKVRDQQKAAADEAKRRADEEKRAAAERRVAEVERIRALKEQQEKESQLADIERQRLEQEKERANLGPYNISQGSGQSGSGSLGRAPVEQFEPQGIQQNSILYLAQMRAALKDNLDAQKELQAQLKAGQITQAEFDKGIVLAGEQEQKYRAIIKETSAEIRARAEVEMSVQNSIAAARKENALLMQERDQLPVGEGASHEDVQRVKELNDQIDKNNELIRKNSDALAQQRINIGNYPGAFTNAFRTLNREMTNLEEKISSGRFQGEELAVLQRRLESLQNAIRITGKEFETVSAQQSAFNEAAKQVGVTFGKDSEVFRQFSKEVGAGNKEVNTLSKTVRDAAAGSSGLAGGLDKVWSMIRRIAFLVPGLGISSLVLLLLAPLKSLGASLQNVFTTVRNGTEDMKALNEVNIKATEAYAKQQAELSALAEVAGDESNTLETRRGALGQLIALSPEYLRGLTLENVATNEGVQLLERYNDALRSNAELKVAQENFTNTQAQIQHLEALVDAFKSLSDNGHVTFKELNDEMREFVGTDFFRGVRNPVKNFFDTELTENEIGYFFTNIGKKLRDLRNLSDSEMNIYNDKLRDKLISDGEKTIGIIAGIQKKIESLRQIQPTLTSEAAIRDNVRQINELQRQLQQLTGDTGKELSKASKLADDFHVKNLKAIGDFARENLTALQSMYKSQSDDQNNSQELRLRSLERFLAISRELNERERQQQIDALSRETSGARTDAMKITNAQARSRTLQEISNFEATQLEIIEHRYQDNITKIDQDGANRQFQIAQDSWQKVRDESEKSSRFIQQQQEIAFQNSIREVDINKFNDLMKLQEDFQSGSIKSVKEYERRRQEIEDDATNKQRQLTLERLKLHESIIEAMYGIKNLDLIKQIKELEFQINDDTNKKILESDKALLNAQKEMQAQRRQMMDEGLMAIEDIVNSSFESRRNNLEKENQRIEENSQRQIDLINAGTLAEEDKQARIKVINDQAAAQQAQVNQRIAKQQEKQAAFAKAFSILQIGINTAQSVAHVTAAAVEAFASYARLGLPGIAIGTAIRSQIMAQIPFILANSALQIGAIMARPIPRYRHGKNFDDNYEGIAVVGDGGKSEYIVREDGTIMKTPDRDTLAYVGKKDIIFPDLKSLALAATSGRMKIKHDSRDSFSNAVREQTKVLRPLLNKIANKRENHLTVKDGAMASIWKHSAGQIKYIEENTNW